MKCSFRAQVADLQQLPQHDFETRMKISMNVVMSIIKSTNMYSAAQECGFEFSEDSKTVCITDANVSKMLNRLEREGELTKVNQGATSYGSLRNHEFMESRRTATQDGRPMTLNRVSERSIQVHHEIVEHYCKSNKLETKSKKNRSTVSIVSTAGARQGTFLATGPEVMQRSAEIYEEKREKKRVETENRQKNEQSKRLAETRLAELSARLKVSIDAVATHQKSTLRYYLNDKKPETHGEEWALSFLRKKLNIEVPPAPAESSNNKKTKKPGNQKFAKPARASQTPESEPNGIPRINIRSSDKRQVKRRRLYGD